MRAAHDVAVAVRLDAVVLAVQHVVEAHREVVGVQGRVDKAHCRVAAGQAGRVHQREHPGDDGCRGAGAGDEAHGAAHDGDVLEARDGKVWVPTPEAIEVGPCVGAGRGGGHGGRPQAQVVGHGLGLPRRPRVVVAEPAARRDQPVGVTLARALALVALLQPLRRAYAEHVRVGRREVGPVPAFARVPDGVVVGRAVVT